MVAVLPSSAAPRPTSTAWQFHWSGKTFGGTFTNPTASVVNGIAIGTSLKEKDAITSFFFAGHKCGLYAQYGSAYCYTDQAVAPGKSASFSGTIQAALGKGGFFQACSSADRGMDNTCVNVTVQSAAPAVSQPDLKLVIDDLETAIYAEDTAISALKQGYSSKALRRLNDAMEKLRWSMKYTSMLPVSAGADVESALHFDTQAIDLFNGKPSGRKAAISKIEDALVDKKAALQTANDAKR